MIEALVASLAGFGCKMLNRGACLFGCRYLESAPLEVLFFEHLQVVEAGSFGFGQG